MAENLEKLLADRTGQVQPQADTASFTSESWVKVNAGDDASTVISHSVLGSTVEDQPQAVPGDPSQAMQCQPQVAHDVAALDDHPPTQTGSGGGASSTFGSYITTDVVAGKTDAAAGATCMG